MSFWDTMKNAKQLPPFIPSGEYLVRLKGCKRLEAAHGEPVRFIVFFRVEVSDKEGKENGVKEGSEYCWFQKFLYGRDERAAASFLQVAIGETEKITDNVFDLPAEVLEKYLVQKGGPLEGLELCLKRDIVIGKQGGKRYRHLWRPVPSVEIDEAETASA